MYIVRKNSGLKQKNIYFPLIEQKNNVVGRRIFEARKEKGYSMQALANLLQERGLNTNRISVNRWEKGETVPNIYQVLALCDVLDIPDCYSFFMEKRENLNAEGLRKVAEYRDDLIASGKYICTDIERGKAVRYMKKPVYLLPVSAGAGSYLDGSEYDMVDFPEESIPNGADYALRVTGDSMEPTYRSQQIVWVKQCETLRSGEIGIFTVDGESFIKEYNETCDPENGHTVCLISHNQKYSPIRITEYMNFNILGKVL